MTIHPLAGKPAPESVLVDVGALRRDYHARVPDPTNRAERVRFGTSGHRGSSLRGGFNEAHIVAITQAICEYRRGGHRRPALPGQGYARAVGPGLRQRAGGARGEPRRGMIDSRDGGYTPTPAVSHAILAYNRGRTSGLARRHRHHAVAQSARGRRLQVQPAAWRAGGHRRHPMDRGPGQPAALSTRPTASAEFLRAGAARRHDALPTTTSART